MKATKNVLVTGGAGYIGSHACKRLKASGYTPITVDNLNTGWRSSTICPLEQLDIRNFDDIYNCIKVSTSCTMHFAALSQVGDVRSLMNIGIIICAVL